MRNTIKTISLVIATILSITFLGNTKAFANTQTPQFSRYITLDNETIKIEVARQKNGQEYIQIIRENGKVETITPFKGENGDTKCLVNIDGKNSLVEKGIDDDIYIDGIKQNVLVKKVTKKSLDNDMNQNMLVKTIIKSPFQLLNSSGWTYLNTSYYSSAVDAAAVSFTISTIVTVLTAGVSLLVGVATGFVSNFVSLAISLGLKTVYYEASKYLSTYDNTYVRQDTTVYKYSGYTGYLASDSWQYHYTNPY